MKWYTILLFHLLVITVVSSQTADEYKTKVLEDNSKTCPDCKTSIKVKQIKPTISKLTKDNAKTIQDKAKYIDKKTNEDEKQSKSRRDTFSKENPFSTLRKQINARDRKPQLMSDARVEPNYTIPAGKYPQYEYTSGSGNYEQDYNKNHNKMRKLFKLHNSLKQSYVLMAGIECDFDRDCSWSWATDVKNGFQVVSPMNYDKLDTGPMLDANNNTDGKLI